MSGERTYRAAISAVRDYASRMIREHRHRRDDDEPYNAAWWEGYVGAMEDVRDECDKDEALRRASPDPEASP